LDCKAQEISTMLTATPTSDSNSAAYIMGRTDRERKRLLLQGSILNPLTYRFLNAAGVSSGLRVLDLGCGIGDVTLIAAHITGPAGNVTGIDVDERALDVARQRAAGENYHHVTFERADFNGYCPHQLFDVVVARHVLLHTADPMSVIRKAASFLVPGGLAAFEEYDLSFWPPGYPQTPLTAAVTTALVQLFRTVTPHANIGMRLSYLLREAGFSNPQSSAACLLEGGPETDFYEWLAETVLSVLPALEKLGLAGVVGEPDTLAQRLRDELLAARASLTSPLIVSAFARKA
jgi:2-polyprenyl-3-methyl-5-hydroxy-6-metoxy-1,4-benzoquinol methylase